MHVFCIVIGDGRYLGWENDDAFTISFLSELLETSFDGLGEHTSVWSKYSSLYLTLFLIDIMLQVDQLIAQLSQIDVFLYEREHCLCERLHTKLDEAHPIIRHQVTVKYSRHRLFLEG